MAQRNEEHDRQLTRDLTEILGITADQAAADVAAANPTAVALVVEESTAPRRHLAGFAERSEELKRTWRDRLTQFRDNQKRAG